MEKKDWKKKLRELSFMKGYYFKLEDNGLVEKKDDQLVFNREELECFVQQELDKAREEGREEGINAVLFPKFKRDKNGTLKREGWVNTSKLKDNK